MVKQIVRVTRIVHQRGTRTDELKCTIEIAFYLSSAEATARQYGAAIRGHWHVENTLHYTRDVTFMEDLSRIRCNPGIFARIRSFAYNILRRNHNENFNQDRYAAALGGLEAVLKLIIS